VHPIWQNNQLVDGGHYQAEAEENTLKILIGITGKSLENQ
jgi:hypothetical protein